MLTVLPAEGTSHDAAADEVVAAVSHQVLLGGAGISPTVTTCATGRIEVQPDGLAFAATQFRPSCATVTYRFRLPLDPDRMWIEQEREVDMIGMYEGLLWVDLHHPPTRPDNQTVTAVVDGASAGTGTTSGGGDRVSFHPGVEEMVLVWDMRIETLVAPLVDAAPHQQELEREVFSLRGLSVDVISRPLPSETERDRRPTRAGMADLLSVTVFVPEDADGPEAAVFTATSMNLRAPMDYEAVSWHGPDGRVVPFQSRTMGVYGAPVTEHWLTPDEDRLLPGTHTIVFQQGGGSVVAPGDALRSTFMVAALVLAPLTGIVWSRIGMNRGRVRAKVILTPGADLLWWIALLFYLLLAVWIFHGGFHWVAAGLPFEPAERLAFVGMFATAALAFYAWRTDHRWIRARASSGSDQRVGR